MEWPKRARTADWASGVLTLDGEKQFEIPELTAENMEQLAGYTLVGFHVKGYPVTDDLLSPFAGHKSMANFGVEDGALTDACFPVFSAMPKLRYLLLDGNAAIHGSGLSALQGCKLDLITLNRSGLDDAGLLQAASIPKLSHIQIDHTAVNAYFRCLSCGHQEIRDRTIYRYDVHNQCKNCGRYYRVDIEYEAKQHYSVLHVACPYCGTTMSGEVHKTAEAFSYIGEIRDGREPYFGLELWFLTSFQGKPVWALNREHLAYLIDYLSADLREKPSGSQKKTQADHLPTFMKTAKNRERIVKLLKKLQEG
ncbi:hypothetical protein [uncultured Oscillibacter sp.]|uniref:hypothetical protein n=1 Tax=uncultured Oscillibacter sp. TaxID=876091 RepID=UPI002804947D|nr:hypothetical protein [uncultured Oscillibacter sp.]